MAWTDIPQVKTNANMFEIDGREYPPYAYMSYFGKEKYYRRIADAGLHIYCIPALMGDQGINSHSGIGPLRTGIWHGEDNFDLSELDNEIGLVRQIDPDAFFFIRLNIDPPLWWEKKYPEGCMQLPDGTTLRQSLASPVWRKHAETALRTTLKKIFDRNYASRIICIHIAGSQTEEWMSRYKPEIGFYDLNPHRSEAFREWMRGQYLGDVKRLRSAWGCEELNFETLQPADISCKAPYPADQSTPYIDTLRFQSHLTVDTIEYFCRTVKEESHGRILTGAFYGYSCYISYPALGHYALSKLLESPWVDVMSSPNMYNRKPNDRSPGEDWPPMTPVDSFALHGKLWLAENDTRTFRQVLLSEAAPDICPPGNAYSYGPWLGPKSPHVSVNALLRDAGRMLSHGYGGWWFDLWGGWYDDERLTEVFATLQKLHMKYPRPGADCMQSEVCVLVNEELCYHDKECGKAVVPVQENVPDIARAGAPYKIVLTEDAVRLPEGAYKLVWLLGTDGNEDTMLAAAKRLINPSGTIVMTSLSGSVVYANNEESSALPQRLGPPLIRTLYKESQVHVYTETEDVLYAGNGWIVLHAAEEGEKVIRLPQKTSLTDVLRGDNYTDTDQIHLTAKQYETVILRVI